MIFGDTPVDKAVGAILAHSRRVGDKRLAKGRMLSLADVTMLKAAGVASVVVARLEPGDVHEDEAARLVAAAICGPGLTVTQPFTGRVNLFAQEPGLAVFDPALLDTINRVDETITVATLPAYAPVQGRQMVATIKIIPFAAPRQAVERCVAEAGNAGLVRVAPFRPRKLALIQTRVAGTKDSVLDKTVATTKARAQAMRCELVAEARCAHDEAELQAKIAELLPQCDLLLIAGASAIVDRRDVVPASIVRAGGAIEHFGMPVDPGNLLLLARLGDKPVLGLPGCARSPKYNGFDQVLQRLVADLPVSRHDIMAMGAGGLLAEIPTRPQPREETEPPPQAPRIVALLLAAGRSSRMGDQNKLLADVAGRPMIARTFDALAKAQVTQIVVVLGHQASKVRQAIGEQQQLRFVDNPDFAQGISTSLQAGLKVLPGDIDGVLVCLADMPAVTTAQIDRLIAAFNPTEGRAICVPIVAGKRGNPVLWAKRFIPAMMGIGGDVGARHLIGENAEAVCEVEMEGDAVLLDLDTPEALAAYRKRAS